MEVAEVEDPWSLDEAALLRRQLDRGHPAQAAEGSGAPLAPFGTGTCPPSGPVKIRASEVRPLARRRSIRSSLWVMTTVRRDFRVFGEGRARTCRPRPSSPPSGYGGRAGRYVAGDREAGGRSPRPTGNPSRRWSRQDPWRRRGGIWSAGCCPLRPRRSTGRTTGPCSPICPSRTLCACRPGCRYADRHGRGRRARTSSPSGAGRQRTLPANPAGGQFWPCPLTRSLKRSAAGSSSKTSDSCLPPAVPPARHIRVQQTDPSRPTLFFTHATSRTVNRIDADALLTL